MAGLVFRRGLIILSLFINAVLVLGYSTAPRSCRKTKVAVLGGGMAGITAAVKSLL